MRHCECGRPIGEAAKVCHECAWLDGETLAEASCIATLRLLARPATSYEIASAWGTTQRSVLRTVAVLQRRGRVRRIAPDGTRTGSRDGCAAFVLADRRRHESRQTP